MAEQQQRRIVVLCDGTWGVPLFPGGGRIEGTNVVELWEAIKNAEPEQAVKAPLERKNDGQPKPPEPIFQTLTLKIPNDLDQILLYDPGVGTGTDDASEAGIGKAVNDLLDEWLGGAF